jgi:hypothetical protein
MRVTAVGDYTAIAQWFGPTMDRNSRLGFVAQSLAERLIRLEDIWGPSRRFQFVGSSQFASEASSVSGTLRPADKMGTTAPAASCRDRASNFKKENSFKK